MVQRVRFILDAENYGEIDSHRLWAKFECPSRLFVWVEFIDFFRMTPLALQACSSGWKSSLER